MSSLVQPNIERIVPYVPGKPIEELQRELGLPRAIKLASNENPLGPSPAAIEAIHQAASQVHYYPDGGGFYLKDALAKKLGVSLDEVLLANGSNEAIELILQAFWHPNGVALTSQATFIVYKLASLAINVRVDEVPMRDHYYIDLDAMAARIDADTRYVFLANPNNPTGTWFDRDALAAFLRKVPEHVIVVLDEAYFEFATDEAYPDGLRMRELHPNLIVLRTFSKAYGLAGLRIGYGVMRPELVDYLNRVRAPFNTNLIAQRAAIAALGDSAFLEHSVSHNARGREQLLKGVLALGLEAVPSATNFVLIKLPRAGAEIFQALLEKGVIVRPMAAYGFPNHIRVSVGLEEEVEEFLSALRQVL